MGELNLSLTTTDRRTNEQWYTINHKQEKETDKSFRIEIFKKQKILIFNMVDRASGLQNWKMLTLAKKNCSCRLTTYLYQGMFWHVISNTSKHNGLFKVWDMLKFFSTIMDDDWSYFIGSHQMSVVLIHSCNDKKKQINKKIYFNISLISTEFNSHLFHWILIYM